MRWGGGRFGKETLGCSGKAVERYLERKWITFIPTEGAVEQFPRKAKRSRVETVRFLEAAPGK